MFIAATVFLSVSYMTSSLLVRMAFAQQPPERPMLITGTVTLNGSPAPTGLTVIAKVESQVRGTATVSGGQYQLVVNGTQGEVINLFLNNLQSSQTATFDNISNGGVLTLDLAFTGTVTTTMATQTQTSVTSTTTTGTTTEIPEFLSKTLVFLGIAALAVAILARSRVKGTHD